MEKGSDIGFKSRCVAGRKVVAKWCIILGTWNGQLLAGNIGRAGFGISDDRTAMYIYIYIDSGRNRQVSGISRKF